MHMQTVILTSFALTLLNSLDLSEGGIYKKIQGKKMWCPKNKISDWTADNSTATICWDCPVCLRGWGSTFSCGDVKRYSYEKRIQCEQCMKGKTFSSRQSTDMCSTCAIGCQKHRIVLQKCNRRSNTVCGGCEKGYYEYKDSYLDIKTCEKCSRCCGDRKDDRVKECIDQGLHPNEVCSIFNEERCKTNDKQVSATIATNPDDTWKTFSNTSNTTPRPAKKVNLSADSKSPHIERPIESSNAIHPTKPETKMEHKSNHNDNINNSSVDPIAIIVPMVFLPALVIIVYSVLLVYKKKKRKKKNTARSDGDEETNEPLRSQRSEESSESPSSGHVVNLNRNGEDQRARETSTTIELQPLQIVNSDINDNKQASTKVGEYFKDGERHSQPAFNTIYDEMDNPNFERDLIAIVCNLGVERLKVHRIQNNYNGKRAFENLLENRAAQDPSKTLEEIAQAFENRRRQDLAENMRTEDRRMQDKKSKADSEQPG